jgi:hypothetical protein
MRRRHSACLATYDNLHRLAALLTEPAAAGAGAARGAPQLRTSREIATVAPVLLHSSCTKLNALRVTLSA